MAGGLIYCARAPRSICLFLFRSLGIDISRVALKTRRPKVRLLGFDAKEHLTHG